MTRLSNRTLALAVALGAALSVADATPVSAQCATCPTPVVAYSPVVAQPVVVAPTVVRTGWYPGAWFDRMRLRRWGATTTVVAAPTITTANFAPTATFVPTNFTTVNRPIITSYAPLQPVMQASFMPVVQTSFAPAPVASSCSSCAQTVMRPVEVTPVVQTVVAAPACSACSVEAPCGGCSSCAGGVSQASVVESAPVASDCPSCAASSGDPYYGASTVVPSGTPSSPATPRPELGAEVPTPAAPQYPESSSVQKPESSVVDPKPEADDAAPGPEAEAGPEADASTSYEFQAPPLVAPQNDRTANRPTVDVHNAVYSSPARQGRVSTTAAKVAATPQAAPTVDANGWYSVSER